ncbi:hypothetical protein [Thalassotalea agariperforans]
MQNSEVNENKISTIRLVVRGMIFFVIGIIFFGFAYILFNFNNSTFGSNVMAVIFLTIGCTLSYVAFRPRNNKVREYLEIILSPLGI